MDDNANVPLQVVGRRDHALVGLHVMARMVQKGPGHGRPSHCSITALPYDFLLFFWHSVASDRTEVESDPD